MIVICLSKLELLFKQAPGVKIGKRTNQENELWYGIIQNRIPSAKIGREKDNAVE